MTRPVKIKPPEKRYIRRDSSGRFIESLEFHQEKARMTKRKRPTQTQIHKRFEAYAAEHPETLGLLTGAAADPALMAIGDEFIEAIAPIVLKAGPSMADYLERSGVDWPAIALLCLAVDSEAPTEEEKAEARDTVAQIFGQMRNIEGLLASLAK